MAFEVSSLKKKEKICYEEIQNEVSLIKKQ